MTSSIKLSLVIPCYNEEKRFSEGINHFLKFLKKQSYKWEIILVNDGSSDKTLNLLKEFSRKNPELKVISYEKNTGKGFAILKGIKVASGKYILFSDVDHSVSIETINNFFKYFQEGYEVVIGSRRVKGAKFIKKQPLLRQLLGRGFSLLVRLFVDYKIKDTTCGFKAFETKAAKKIFNKITIYDWAFDAEILYLCKKYNIDYAQVPVAWSDVRGSKVSVFRDVIRSLVGLLTIRLNDIQNKY
ncbi:MAG: hypothetical protein UU34_C0001G0124 [Candidatus Curtissbacteria bacterium GW2011_GWA1_41_11]|uniref:dolichyl-phosphate beta-glucosyltransferase n=1 Tax=Candidatus Curtissbacteria bacterium GW2011_GWA1_41_11 TaxID=1618409 RepID=A0A0G0XKE8_9BACT|nr:MAG: hypothetical protein UU34_C0001G0124 [Candidatus Curtissbacteria bacterium GW2011_GWA1_41_11]